jgi:cathepsin D
MGEIEPRRAYKPPFGTLIDLPPISSPLKLNLSPRHCPAMQFSSLVALTLMAALSSVFASPLPGKTLTIPISKKRDLFTLANSQVVNFGAVTAHLNSLKSKYATTLASYQKNTGQVHPLVVSIPIIKRATGTVSLTDVQESLWHGAITLGSSTAQCDFDTGSADIIIEPEAYSPGSTAKDTGKTFTASYGDGTTASGEVYTDTVSVGGLKTTSVSIGASSSDFLSSDEGDSGICGMSYPSISVLGSGSTPFFDALIKNGVVSSHSFTFTLSTSGSRIYLGGVDPNAGSPSYTSISNQGYWQVSDSSINGISTSSIVDTGTSLIVAPTATARSVFKAVGATTFTQDGTLYGAYNCNSAPTVTYRFGSFSKSLSAATLSIGTTNNGQCVLSVVGEDIGINAVIAGDSFLQNVHAVFDRTNNRVGFTSQ